MWVKAGGLEILLDISVRQITVERKNTKIGEKHPKSTIPDSDVEQMRELHEVHGIGYSEIAKKWELPLPTVRDIIYYRRRCASISVSYSRMVSCRHPVKQ